MAVVIVSDPVNLYIPARINRHWIYLKRRKDTPRTFWLKLEE